jgi:hypothetical protein
MQLLARHNMELALPLSTYTFESEAHLSWSTIDLVHCSVNLIYQLIACDTGRGEHIPGADHLAIHTIFNIEHTRQTQELQ